MKCKNTECIHIDPETLDECALQSEISIDENGKCEDYENITASPNDCLNSFVGVWCD